MSQKRHSKLKDGLQKKLLELEKTTPKESKTRAERVFGVNGQMTGLYLGSVKSGTAANKEF